MTTALEPSQMAPHSQDAEEAVLGSILINPDAYFEVASFLKPEDFFILRNAWVWEAMSRLHERGEVIEYLTVIEELRNQSRLDHVGGAAYITYLASNVATSIYAEAYGRIVERSSIRRRMLEAAAEIAQVARDEESDIKEVMDKAERALFSVTERSLKKDTVPIQQAMSEYFDRVEFLYENRGEPIGVPTGFTDLDNMLGGFQKSDLLILAARPGVGKTSLMLNIAMNAARSKARVGVFSLEMSNEQLVQRLVSTETGINTHKLRLGELNEKEWELFVDASGRLGELPIYLDDTPALGLLQLRTKCRRLYREHGLDLVVIDYLQLMTASNSSGGRNDNRVQEISTISRGLKELARELNVPVLAGSQLSRSVEQRTDKRPVLSDLRESGCVTGDSLVTLADSGREVPIRQLIGQTGFAVWALNQQTMKLERAIVTNSFSSGVRPVFRMTTRLGRSIRATANHKFYMPSGWVRLDKLEKLNDIALPAGEPNIDGIEQGISEGIYWDSIISIEPDGVEEVFDLTVEPHHSFICNNIVISNSIEQDADLVMFIYRDDLYNENSERPNEADIIVAKHRNGATGNVVLFFRKELTQFANLAKTKVNLEGF